MPTFQTEIRISKPDEKVKKALSDYLNKRVTVESQTFHHLTNEHTEPAYLRFETRGSSISDLTRTVAEAVRETGQSLSFTIIRNKN